MTCWKWFLQFICSILWQVGGDKRSRMWQDEQNMGITTCAHDMPWPQYLYLCHVSTTLTWRTPGISASQEKNRPLAVQDMPGLTTGPITRHLHAKVMGLEHLGRIPLNKITRKVWVVTLHFVTYCNEHQETEDETHIHVAFCFCVCPSGSLEL